MTQPSDHTTPDSTNTEDAVRLEITVDAPIDTAFTVFTTGINSWWPREHHIGSGTFDEAVVQPRVGGRLLTRETDGTECPWGTVLVWQPPTRFAFSWDIALDWTAEIDPRRSSRVEVTFTTLDDTHTRVTLVHCDFDRHGPGWQSMRTAVASDGGWPALRDNYAKAAAAQSNRVNHT